MMLNTTTTDKPMTKTKPLFVLIVALLLSGHAAGSNSTFEKVCQSCHTGGFKGWISGAPNVNKPETWAKYLERDSIETMQQIVINGSADHKVKGDCDRCTDQQVIDAINYMMSRVK